MFCLSVCLSVHLYCYLNKKKHQMECHDSLRHVIVSWKYTIIIIIPLLSTLYSSEVLFRDGCYLPPPPLPSHHPPPLPCHHPPPPLPGDVLGVGHKMVSDPKQIERKKRTRSRRPTMRPHVWWNGCVMAICVMHDMLCMASSSFGLLKKVDFHWFFRGFVIDKYWLTDRWTLDRHRCKDVSNKPPLTLMWPKLSIFLVFY